MKSYPAPMLGNRIATFLAGLTFAAALVGLAAEPAGAESTGSYAAQQRCIRLGQVVWLHDRRTELQVARAGRLSSGSARERRRVPRFIASSQEHRARAK